MEGGPYDAAMTAADGVYAWFPCHRHVPGLRDVG